MAEQSTSPLTGIWVSPEGNVHLSHANPDGSRKESLQAYSPFFWTNNSVAEASSSHQLKGVGLNYLNEFDSLASYKVALSCKPSPLAVISSLENQYLLKNKCRLFDGMHLSDVRRLQCDIETACSQPGGFSNAKRAGDRVLAIGLRMKGKNEILTLEEMTDAAELKLFEAFNAKLKELDPDIIEGHNFFKFDLDFLRIRYARYKMPCAWGRFNQEATFRNSRYKVAERWVDFPRCEIPGRTVFDTYLGIQRYDVTKREMESYSLKSVAVYLGLSDEEERTYLPGDQIQSAFEKDRETFIAYLEDDLRETQGVADFLLPTYFAQAQSFPLTFQEILLRGSSVKLELVFQEQYYHARQALPFPQPVETFAGGFTKSFKEGVFHNVLHFDVASLYPSLLLAKNKNPSSDTLHCFIPILRSLKEYRFEYKKKAKEEKDPDLRNEYDARQNAFKTLINSFYGYLGFEGARLADSELAAQITAEGRELLQNLIKKFEELGCQVLEADTDGIYIASKEHFDAPDKLLQEVSTIMPKGVGLEFDGVYNAMFCYKAKNYALREGDKVIIRGSSLRSRATEPFLRDLTNELINYALGFEGSDPNALKEKLIKDIELAQIEVKRLAKSERLSQSPEKYAEAVKLGKTPRRASLEVALKCDPVPRMGDLVTYFISIGEKKRMPDWQVAHPLKDYNELTCPYDPSYYLKKIKDWEKKYGSYT